jgi:formylglycine-generating enzyme required for sulfatase activity
MTNIGWLEYLFWTKWVFGKNSEEYKMAFPDTAVWLGNDTCLHSYAELYLRHPAYRDWPLVGISQKQAIDYTKWRSDRVFEYILINYNKIKIDSTQNKDTYFTIDKYLSGNYSGYIPDTNFLYYPNYRLPTIQEWQYVVHYSDSIEKKYYREHPKQKCKDCKTEWSNFQSDIIPCNNDTDDVVLPVKSFKGPFYNLRGNVSEWTNEKDICIGGGWHDTKERILANDTFYLKGQNSWTGFRNVCEWKKWKR